MFFGKRSVTFLVLRLCDTWRPLSGAFSSLYVSSRNYLLTEVNEPAFKVLINLQMLCSSICPHLHITSAHVDICLNVNAFNTQMCRGPYKFCLQSAD